MFTALATTRIPTVTEIISSAIIMSFAHGLTAETSVGLNAIAVFTAAGGSQPARKPTRAPASC